MLRRALVLARSDFLDVTHVFRRHFLRGNFDDYAVNFVKTNFAVLVSQEGRFDTELTGTVVPDPGLVARGRTYQELRSK
jgi:hypothetical protein